MRRPGARRLVVTLLAAGVLVGVAAPGHAADVDGSWWSELNTGLPIGLPVSVPTLPALSSDLMVQELPDGPAAVAAIRLPVPEGTVPRTLTVHFTAPAATVTLTGCATAFTWATASGGAWDARPSCNGAQVPLTLSTDETTATLDVTRLDQTTIQQRGLVEVLLQPSAGSVAFVATLDPPATTDLTGSPVGAGASSAVPPQPVETASAPARPATSPAGRARPAAVQPAGPAATGTPATQVAPAAAPALSPAALPALPVGSTATPQLAPTGAATPAQGPAQAQAQAQQPAAAAASVVTHTNRRVPALLLALLLLAAAATLTLRTRVPVLLTSRARTPAPGTAAPNATPPTTVAGLGRHRQPRTGRPPRL